MVVFTDIEFVGKRHMMRTGKVEVFVDMFPVSLGEIVVEHFQSAVHAVTQR